MPQAGRGCRTWRTLKVSPVSIMQNIVAADMAIISFPHCHDRNDTEQCNKTAISNDLAGYTTPTLFTRQGRFPHGYEVGDSDGLQLRFVQTDHRGGHCDCWGIACDILLLNSSDHIVNIIRKQ